MQAACGPIDGFGAQPGFREQQPAEQSSLAELGGGWGTWMLHRFCARLFHEVGESEGHPMYAKDGEEDAAAL